MSEDINWQERPFIEYLNAVDDLLEKRYGITSDDTNMQAISSAQENGESPGEFAEWFGDKYELERSDLIHQPYH